MCTFSTPTGNFLRQLYLLRKPLKCSGHHLLALPRIKTKALRMSPPARRNHITMLKGTFGGTRASQQRGHCHYENWSWIVIPGEPVYTAITTTYSSTLK